LGDVTMEWQPIETAPKDGTEVLVWNGGNDGFYTTPGQMGVAYWGRQGFPERKRAWCASDCCDGVTTYTPTHWMPLPAPPQI
jgi:hypothetical protein